MSTANPPSPEGIHALYSDHHGWLHNWLRRQLGCSADAADLAHDTFLRILVRHRTADLGAEPRALLTHIARGLVTDLWRRRRVESAYLYALAHCPNPEVPSEEARLVILDTLCRIDAMLAAMPGHTREIFLLAQLDGLRYAEIAGRLGLSLITVKRHMSKAFLACLELA